MDTASQIYKAFSKSQSGHIDSSWLPNLIKQSKYSPWKHISNNRSFFEIHISYKVGNGETIQILEDNWATRKPFCEEFPPQMQYPTPKGFLSSIVGLLWVKLGTLRRRLLDGTISS
ncbi:hypothetical protein E5676_scaffold807G00150 [Cucumis melo var. makuwa]|uniref:Uncharacterized protein n=1 Tax=Cucumis melo var. makuwa TaxID=1194695 RepID=A0A5D3CHQ9_CUCMM|nr:hypothetical protein E5676_scaffold807G00150 [Cucumis melo var. makuwa]